jgi:hypothetical protein
MKSHIPFIALLILWLPVIVFAQRQPDDGGAASCSGTVFDKNTQQPLNGAKITVTNTEQNKKLTTTTSASEGTYSFTLNPVVDIEIEVTLSGYKKASQRFTKTELLRHKWRIPAIYLDTTIKLDLKPAEPVRQSKKDYIDNKLQAKNIIPGPGASELLLYLNPDLKNRDSLMSNDKIIFPKIPNVSKGEKKANKKPFQDAKDRDRATQNRLRDTIDKVSRILGENIATYKIRYENTNAGAVTQLRDYIRMDLQDYQSQISNTSKLKAEDMIVLLSKMGEVHQQMITKRNLSAAGFNQMKLLWEDLSYLLDTKRYMLFARNSFPGQMKGNDDFRMASYFYTGSSTTTNDRAIQPPESIIPGDQSAPPFNKDEVGYFGFLVWSEKLTSPTKPDLSEPGSRYLIRYFKPALEGDTSRYELCRGVANVATANLTRARYGIKIYDTKEKKYVETLDPTFTTEPAFESTKYDAWFMPDFKEIKYIIIHLK